MIMSDGGIIIRISLKQVGVYSRAAQGVKFINLLEDHIVSSVAVVAPDGETEEEETTFEKAEQKIETVEVPKEKSEEAKIVKEELEQKNNDN